MSEYLEIPINKINDVLCTLYPDDKVKCLQDTQKNNNFKIVIYILFILLGIFIFRNGPELITHLVKKFNGIISIILIIYGGISLIKLM
jgi:hypothetical protein